MLGFIPYKVVAISGKRRLSTVPEPGTKRAKGVEKQRKKDKKKKRRSGKKQGEEQKKKNNDKKKKQKKKKKLSQMNKKHVQLLQTVLVIMTSSRSIIQPRLYFYFFKNVIPFIEVHVEMLILLNLIPH